MTQCKCGRSSNQNHCKACGSLNVYNRRSLSIYIQHNTPNTLLEDTKLTEVKGFRCRKCGSEFRENDPCNAPSVDVVPALDSTKVSETVKAINEAGGVKEYLTDLFNKK